MARKTTTRTCTSSTCNAAYRVATCTSAGFAAVPATNNKKTDKAKLIHQRSSVLFAWTFSLAGALAAFSIMSAHPHQQPHLHHSAVAVAAPTTITAKESITKSRHNDNQTRIGLQLVEPRPHPRSVHTELQSKLQTTKGTVASIQHILQMQTEDESSIQNDMTLPATTATIVTINMTHIQLSDSAMESNTAIFQQFGLVPMSEMMTQNPILRLFYNAGVSNISITDYKALPDVWRNWKELYYDDDTRDDDDDDVGYNSNNQQQDDHNHNNIINNDHKYEPIVLGMETCRAYRERVPRVADRYSGPAGLFNTGTNALEFALKHNINNYNAHHHHRAVVVWQVPWGKHRMVEKERLHHVAPGMQKYKHENCLPIVIIRDPYHWLQSMCKMPYSASWRHDANRCPNLVPTPEDRTRFKDISMMPPLIHSIHNNNSNTTTTANTHMQQIVQKEEPATFSVKVVFEKHNVEYFDSLVDLWSEWYRPYFVQATTTMHSSSSSSWSLSNNVSSSLLSYPVLMIRHEDLLLNGPKVIKMIAQCIMGGKDIITSRRRPRRPFRYQTDTAKSHGSGTNLIQAILQAGDPTRRNRGGGNEIDDDSNSNIMMTRDDLLYAASHLNHDMMKAFHYKFIVPSP